MPVAHAKYYTPDSNWTWYILEGEGKYRYSPSPKRLKPHIRSIPV
jgi:hypothetical protein